MYINILFQSSNIMCADVKCDHSKQVDDGRMTRCLTRELETLVAVSGVNHITSVFFGGGKTTAQPTRPLLLLVLAPISAGNIGWIDLFRITMIQLIKLDKIWKNTM